MLLLEATLPTEPFKFFACPIMAYFRESLHESNTISVKHALHVVKIQFWTLRPNSCALASAGSVMTTGLSINGCSHSKKPVWREKTRLTSPDVWAAVTSNSWRNSGRSSFSPPLYRRQQEGSARRVICCLFVQGKCGNLSNQCKTFSMFAYIAWYKHERGWEISNPRWSRGFA